MAKQHYEEFFRRAVQDGDGIDWWGESYDLWRGGVLADGDAVTVIQLSEWIDSHHLRFQGICSPRRSRGKMLMAWSGFAAVADRASPSSDPLEDVNKLLQAFRSSHCGVDTKAEATKAAAELGAYV